MSKKSVNEYYNLPRHEMLGFAPKTAQMILDVGCGAGAFGAQLKECFPTTVVWGIEPDHTASQLARTKLDHVITAEFSKVVELPEKQLDCVFFNDVLEHMYDPWAALDSAKKILNTGGVVVASIPNLKLFSIMWDLLFYDEWVYKSSGVLDITHIRFFTKKMIVRLFEDSGYSVHLIKGINAQPQGKKFRLLNFLLPSYFSEMRFLQFAVVAQPRR